MFSGKRHHREVGEIPLAPIIDMLVCVIFFLILSTSFLEYNKLTLPPASTSVYNGPTVEKPTPPISPHFYVAQSKQGFSFSLKWQGENPDDITKRDLDRKELEKEIKSAFQEFHKKFPDEKSVQLTLAEDVPYQILVAAMDSITPEVPDVVLSSYEDIAKAEL